jgi:hypothetical protein
VVALVANPEGGVVSAVKVFALGKERGRKCGIGKEGFGGGGAAGTIFATMRPRSVT